MTVEERAEKVRKDKIKREQQIRDRLLILPILILMIAFGFVMGCIGTYNTIKDDWITDVGACEVESSEMELGLTAGFSRMEYNIDLTSVEENETEVVEESYEPIEVETETPEQPYSDYDLDLLARLVYSESGTCDEYTMRMVADVVLNRMASSKYPNTIYGVIYDSGQYAVTWTGAINKYPSDVAYEIATESLDYYYETGHTSIPSNVYGQAGFVLNGWEVYAYRNGIYFTYER